MLLSAVDSSILMSNDKTRLVVKWLYFIRIGLNLGINQKKS
jgi:hypothetical protein